MLPSKFAAPRQAEIGQHLSQISAKSEERQSGVPTRLGSALATLRQLRDFLRKDQELHFFFVQNRNTIEANTNAKLQIFDFFEFFRKLRKSVGRHLRKSNSTFIIYETILCDKNKEIEATSMAAIVI